MPKKYKITGLEPDVLPSEEKLTAPQRQRCRAVKRAISGRFTAAQIAEDVGSSRRTFFYWMKKLKHGGPQTLLENRNHRGGAKPKLSAKITRGILTGIESHQMRKARDIQRWIRNKHKVKLGLNGVYYYLGKLWPEAHRKYRENKNYFRIPNPRRNRWWRFVEKQ